MTNRGAGLIRRLGRAGKKLEHWTYPGLNHVPLVEPNSSLIPDLELALDDHERHAFVRHLDGVSVPELVWREATSHPGFSGRMM